MRILCNFGVFQMMILRFNVSMAIVCMTKNDTVNGTIHNTTINDKTVSFRKFTTPYSILQKHNRMKKCGQDIISNTFTAKIRRIQLEQGNKRTNSELVFLWLYLYSIDWRYNIRQMGRKGRNVVWYRNTFVRKYFVSCNGKVRQVDIKMTSKI